VVSSALRTPAGRPAGADLAARRWVAARRRGLVLAALLGLLALAALWAVEYRGDGLPGQQGLYDRTKASASAMSVRWRPLHDFPASLGSPPVALLTVATLALVLWRRLGVRAAVYVVACSAVVVPDALLNELLGPTPTFLAGVSGSAPNFPSGHTTYATAVFGGLGLLALVHRAVDLALLGAAAVVLMAASRVLFGVHYLSDVLAGFALGAAWLSLVALAIWGLPGARARSLRA
jgi:undecaprenyl-diphosphatase